MRSKRALSLSFLFLVGLLSACRSEDRPSIPEEQSSSIASSQQIVSSVVGQSTSRLTTDPHGNNNSSGTHTYPSVSGTQSYPSVTSLTTQAHTTSATSVYPTSGGGTSTYPSSGSGTTSHPTSSQVTTSTPTSQTSSGSSQSGQSQSGTSSLNDIATVYNLYLDNGGSLTYGEFIDVLNRGGVAPLPNVRYGNSVPSASFGSNGELYVNASNWDFYLKVDSQWENMGNIKSEEQELEYYLLNDGTYAVGLGNAKYLYNVAIPSIHRGKEVTMIADNFYPSDLSGSSLNIVRTFTFPNTIHKIGDHAFDSVPRTTTLDIPYTLASVDHFTFGESWCNTKVQLRLTDQTISIVDTFDSLEVRLNGDLDVNVDCPLTIEVGSAHFGGLILPITKVDENLSFNCDDDSFCSVTYSNEAQSYVLNCTRLGSSTVHFYYNELTYDLPINLVTDNLFRSGFAECIFYNSGSTSFEYENEFHPDYRGGSYLTLYKNRNVSIMGMSGLHPFTYQYHFSATLNGEEVDVSSYIEDTMDIDDSDYSREIIFLTNFPHEGADDSQTPRIHIQVTATSYGVSRTQTATFHLAPTNITFEHVSIEEIYDRMDPNVADSFVQEVNSYTYQFITNKNVETQGKLIYATDDGNFGIIQDGNNFMQVYNILSSISYGSYIIKNYIGENVIVKGQMTFGYGNPMLSYVSSIRLVKDGDTTHPVADGSSFIFDKAKLSNSNWKENPLFNQVAPLIEATVVDGRIYEVARRSGGQPTTITEVSKTNLSPNQRRYEFKVRVNGVNVLVNTNYHACRDDNSQINEFGSELKTFLETKVIAGAKIKIGGFISWENDRQISEGTNYAIINQGTWTINPFLTEHLGETEQFESIELTNGPARTSYYAQEHFNPSGMVVTGTFENGTTMNITEYCTFSPQVLKGSTCEVVVSFGTETISIIPVTVADWTEQEKVLFRTYLNGFEDVPYMPINGAILETFESEGYTWVTYYGGESSMELIESYVMLFDESWTVEPMDDGTSFWYECYKACFPGNGVRYDIRLYFYGINENGEPTRDGSGTFYMDCCVEC